MYKLSREWVQSLRSKKKSATKSYIIISIISVFLLASIVVVVVFKNKQASSSGELLVENEPSKQEIVSETSEEDNLKDNDKDKDKPTESKQPSSEETKKNSKDAKANYVPDAKEPSEPTYVNGILVVNKQYGLPASYNKDVDPEAQAALTKMIQAAKEKGFALQAFSAFRSYEYQTSLYNRYVDKDGKEAADRYSARPGFSEHQTGLAFDIGEVGREDLWLTEAFGETEAGKWLIQHAHEYGFILRYPKGKENVTGFMYESWHYRFVGKEHAHKIYNQSVTLEEYLDIVQY